MTITADVTSSALAIRKAGMRDIPNILSLINAYLCPWIFRALGFFRGRARGISPKSVERLFTLSKVPELR